MGRGARAARSSRSAPGKPGIVTEESKPTTQSAPLLYDLTSLQREANGRFGLSARTTLSLAQALYEKHKVLTYPRTDSRALPEDYLGTVKATMEALAEIERVRRRSRAQVLKQKWVKPNKRIFDNAKISDHFAIIPTLVQPKHLNELEAKLYDFVVKRFLAVFYPPAEFTVTTRITRVDGEPFKSEGKVLVDAGLARGLRQGSAGRGRQRSRRSQPGEKVATEKVEAVPARDASAAAPERSDAALRDGRRGQADRRRGAARGDAREGPRHAGHARADHRRPDRRAIHLPRGQGARSRPRRRSR